MRSQITVLAVCVLCAVSCQQSSEPTLGRDLQDLIEATVADGEAIHGAALHVDSPQLGIDWEGAAGMADPENAVAMTPTHPVRIASNTKTFVAASILRLWEEGELELDDPIAYYLPHVQYQMLRMDGYDPEAMTIRHLLTHTSGLYDHSSGAEYGEAIVADPMHRWTRSEQFELAIELGDPHGEPGEFYTYCDTGYVLLGGIIEGVTGKGLGEAVRELVGYERLGLGSTWWETLEPRPDRIPDRAHQFLGDLDTANFDPSFDLYGGGGIVTTVGEMAAFYRALFTGGVFKDSATVDMMLTTIDGAEALPNGGPPGYRMGIWVVEVEGFEAYRHTGFFGTLADYVPELDLTVAVTVNQNQSGGALNETARQAIEIVAAQASGSGD
jgi:D-alanyl-D-alanine carboxypeptidase